MDARSGSVRTCRRRAGSSAPGKRVEPGGGAGVDADGLDPEAGDRRLVGQPGAPVRRARRVRAVVVGVRERGRRRRDPQPVRSISQAPSGSVPFAACHASRCAGSSRKSGSSSASAVKSSTAAGPTSRAGGMWSTLSAVLPETQCVGASRWVPVCSPVCRLFQRHIGPASSKSLTFSRVAAMVFANGGGSCRIGVSAQRRREVNDLDAAGRDRRLQGGQQSGIQSRDHLTLLINRFIDKAMLAAGAGGRRSRSRSSAEANSIVSRPLVLPLSTLTRVSRRSAS